MKTVNTSVPISNYKTFKPYCQYKYDKRYEVLKESLNDFDLTANSHP